VTTKIRLAVNSDVAAVTDCVCQAFIHYIPRIGKQPGPMLDDYHSLVTQQAVYVACKDQEIVGAVVLLETEEGFCIETIAVHPNAQGLGVGGQLLACAEHMARQFGYKSLYLSTHRLMHESQAVYAHLGYVEFDQRVVNGYDRIFMRKSIL
jgi:N-acetylglutamate synthase-like GNAT family acetyltransferase